MIRSAIQKLASIPAVFIDGSLYVLIALFGALSAAFSTDEAAKYLHPEHLFWLRTICNVNAAWLLALKMFRSTSYSQHVVVAEEKKKLEDTQMLKRQVNLPGT